MGWLAFTVFCQQSFLAQCDSLAEQKESVRVKKVPLFEYEIPRYRKRITGWQEQKQTR